MKEIPLTPVPRQSLSTQIGKVYYELSAKECNGIMGITVVRDGVTIVDNRRACAGVPIIPQGYLESGNFVVLTDDEEIPYFDRFNGKDIFLYIPQEDLEAIGYV